MAPYNRMTKVEERKSEELKVPPVGKKQDVRTVDLAFLLGSKQLRAVVTKCFDNSPTILHTLAHESMDEGESFFQNFIMAELMSLDKVPYIDRRVDIKPVNADDFRDISLYIQTNKAAWTQHLIKFYSDSLNSFKELRYCFVRYVYPHANFGGTSFYPPDDPSVAKKINQAIDAGVVIVKALEQITVLAAIRCETLITNINERLRRASSEAEKNKIRMEYVEGWTRFFASSLELQYHLQPLCDVVNDATTQLLPNLKTKLPAFSLWRILTTTFRTFAHLPLHTEVEIGFVNNIRNACFKCCKYNARVLSLPPGKTMADTVAAFKEGKLEADDGGASVMPEYRTHWVVANRCYQTLVDFEMNEVTVHYLRSKRVCIQACLNLTKPVVDLVQDVYTAAKMEGVNIEQLQKMLGETKMILEKVLLPCMWDAVEKEIHSVLRDAYLVAIDPHLQNFSQLSPDKKRFFKAKDVPLDSDDDINNCILERHRINNTRYVLKNEVPFFLCYLVQTQKDLYDKLVFQCMELKRIAAHEDRVEDIDIEQKNEYLGLSELNNPTAHSYFTFGGTTSFPASLTGCELRALSFC